MTPRLITTNTQLIFFITSFPVANKGASPTRRTGYNILARMLLQPTNTICYTKQLQTQQPRHFHSAKQCVQHLHPQGEGDGEGDGEGEDKAMKDRLLCFGT